MSKAKKSNTRARKKKSFEPTKSMDDLVGYCEDGETIEVSENITDYVLLLYGESASGKTSTLANAPGSYVIQLDHQRRGLKIRQTNIPNYSLAKIKKNSNEHTPWEIVEATVEKILEDDSVETVIIDNFKVLYDHASNHYCKKHMVDSLSEMEDFGVSWNNVDAMYYELFQSICDSGRGLFLITHQKVKEITLPDDTVIEQIQPDLSGRAMQAVREITDFAFYLGFESDGNRALTVRHEGNDIWYKCCTDVEEPHFMSPSGTTLNQISGGKSAKECWENLLLAWDNKIKDLNYVAPKSEKKKKKGRRRSKTK